MYTPFSNSGISHNTDVTYFYTEQQNKRPVYISYLI